MNIALIADIHGNAVALDAALADIDRGSPDHILCLGDVAAGPRPLACLHTLREREIPCVLGNADVELLSPENIEPNSDTMERVRDIQFWCNAQLNEADRVFVQSFRDTVDLPLGDAHHLFCFHGTPHSNTDILSAITPDDEVAPMLVGHEHATIFAGRPHAPATAASLARRADPQPRQPRPRLPVRPRVGRAIQSQECPVRLAAG